MKFATPWCEDGKYDAYRIVFPDNEHICDVVMSTNGTWRMNTFFGRCGLPLPNRSYWEEVWAKDFVSKEEAMECFDKGWAELGYETVSMERAKRLMLLI